MASAKWERRNALARERGYANYYDYRLHDYGRIPPNKPRLTGEQAAGISGRVTIKDLIRAFTQPDPRASAVFFDPIRDKEGQIIRWRVSVSFDDLSVKEFVIPWSTMQKWKDKLRMAISQADDIPVAGSPPWKLKKSKRKEEEEFGEEGEVREEESYEDSYEDLEEGFEDELEDE